MGSTADATQLLDGRVVSTAYWMNESAVVARLTYLLAEWTDKSRWVFGPGCGLRISESTVRNPSAMVVSRRSLPSLGSDPVSCTPDLVAEVRRHGTRAASLRKAVQAYCAAGIPLIWVIYPGTRHAHVLGADRPRTELGPDGVLDGEDVLPGFTCSLTKLFAAAEPES